MTFKDTFFVLGNRTIHIHQLPLPCSYYQQQFSGLRRTDQEWISVKCCFHEDKQPSLRLNLNNGSFRCFGCGVCGGSIVSFHRQRYSLTLAQTILALGGRYV